MRAVTLVATRLLHLGPWWVCGQPISSCSKSTPTAEHLLPNIHPRRRLSASFRMMRCVRDSAVGAANAAKTAGRRHRRSASDAVPVNHGRCSPLPSILGHHSSRRPIAWLHLAWGAPRPHSSSPRRSRPAGTCISIDNTYVHRVGWPSRECKTKGTPCLSCTGYCVCHGDGLLVLGRGIY